MIVRTLCERSFAVNAAAQKNCHLANVRRGTNSPIHLRTSTATPTRDQRAGSRNSGVLGNGYPNLPVRLGYTAFAPMPWWAALGLSFKFKFLRIFPRTELRRHHFVYFGRWTMLPWLRGTGKWQDRYVLIETNYNGSFSEYLDTLSVDTDNRPTEPNLHACNSPGAEHVCLRRARPLHGRSWKNSLQLYT
jgi:hypothetical protein